MIARLSNVLVLVAMMFFVAGVACAQAADPIPPASEQSEAFRDTLARMQIKREESEHKKLLDKATQIRELAKDLLKASVNGHLSHSVDKKLRDIEKNARHIRSESGGGNDDAPLETPPQSLNQAVEQLDSLSERFNASMEKTSRRIISATVVGEATEIIQLVKIIRGLLH